MSVSHPSSIRPFFIFKPRHHAFPNASSPQRETALLPNDDILPTADAFTECFEGNLLPNCAFSTKLGPQVSLFPVPIFGVNICPFNYGIKDDSIPELTINAQRPQAESVQHPFFPPLNRWSFRPDPNPSSSTFQAQSSNGEPRPSSSSKSYPPQAHSVLLFSNLILNFSFALSCS
jgi:hypothetical protein